MCLCSKLEVQQIHQRRQQGCNHLASKWSRSPAMPVHQTSEHLQISTAWLAQLSEICRICHHMYQL